MSEQDMRQRLIQALRPLHGVSIENKIGAGTPDINYTGGWIECKWLRNWPKRAGTPVLLDHDLTLEQRLWLNRRVKCGGVAWVILQRGREWLIFNGCTAATFLGIVPRKQLYSLADKVMLNGLEEATLLKVLTG